MHRATLQEASNTDHIQSPTQEPRYWPVEFERGKNWETLTTILRGSGEVFVKQRAGHLSYDQDPKGYRSQLIQSLSRKARHVQRLHLDAILDDDHLRHLSSDAEVQAFARLFCTRVGGGGENEATTLCVRNNRGNGSSGSSNAISHYGLEQTRIET